MADLLKQLEDGYKAGRISRKEYDYFKSSLGGGSSTGSQNNTVSIPKTPAPVNITQGANDTTKSAGLPSANQQVKPIATAPIPSVKSTDPNYGEVPKSGATLLSSINVTSPLAGPSAKTATSQSVKTDPNYGESPKYNSTNNLPGSLQSAVNSLAQSQYAGPQKTYETTKVNLPQPKSDYDTLLEQLQKQIQDAINQPSTSYEDLYKDIMAQLPADVTPSILSWDEAVKQAQQNVNPLYDESQKNLAKIIDINNIRSGFYGQKPGDAFKAERLSTEENARLQAINSLASQLQGLSRQDAQNVINTNMAKQQQAMQALTNAMNYASAKDNKNLQNLWSLVELARQDKQAAKEDRRYDEQIARDESRYQDSQNWMQKDWLQRMREFTAAQGWKQTEWDDYVARANKAETNAEREWIANEPVRQAQLKGLQINNRMNELKLEALPKQIEAELKGLQSQLNNATTESEYQSILNDLNLAIKAVELDTATQKLNDLYKGSPDSKGMKYENYLDYLLKMANETITVVSTDQYGMPMTTTQPKYTWADMKGVIESLNVNPTWKNSLLNDTGTAVMYRNSK